MEIKMINEVILNCRLISKLLLIGESLEASAARGISSSFYYLGQMYATGIHVKKNYEKAIDCYIKGAARCNALCYYELSSMYKSGEHVEEGKNRKLSFLYLKRSAEEGYILAQHHLAQEYHSGTLTSRNDLLSLAWHRQATKNGFYFSYIPAADLLYYGSGDDHSDGGGGGKSTLKEGGKVRRDLMFALVHYIAAY